ncbi:MAG: DUF47 family protein [Coriobacteriales bacterium]|jgi:uncharacterized protein Yka (UPF0111/DUF47 family)|nr:DUF47 family protein [Coriobacteriales bacterium]
MAKIRFNYFDAFERMAEYACKEAELLHQIYRDFSPETVVGNLAKMHDIENRADGENHEIYKHLANEFVTPIEREDIITLAQDLDNIVDYIEDVVQRLYMFNVQHIPQAAIDMVVLIEKSTTTLLAALKDFRNFKKSKTLERLLISVNDYEEEADKTYLEAIRDLYLNHTDDPVYILAWNNLYTRMEKCVDTCENTATVISTIIMKNS